MSLIVPAVKFRQRRTTMYAAAFPVSKLEQFSIDIWDPKNVARKRGYQRNPDEGRIKKIAKYFERKNSIMPVAGLLNIREAGKVKFSNGRLTIPDGTQVWVVDMQHRLKGLIEAREQRILKDDFYFPVVITEGLTQVEEAAQFYIINTKSKKMGVDLTRRLLIEKGLIRDIADVQPWEIYAVQATIDLNTNSNGGNNPWYEAIRQPNEERKIPHIATEKSFVASLRTIFISGRNKQAKRVARRLANMWVAIKANVPEAFQDPRKCLIQKTPGMFAFNFFIAPSILARYKDKDFNRALKGLKELGAGFWRRSNKTGARRFGSGMGGYSNLADHIKKYL